MPHDEAADDDASEAPSQRQGSGSLQRAVAAAAAAVATARDDADSGASDEEPDLGREGPAGRDGGGITGGAAAGGEAPVPAQGRQGLPVDVAAGLTVVLAMCVRLPSLHGNLPAQVVHLGSLLAGLL